jgi:hypothetical protein
MNYAFLVEKIIDQKQAIIIYWKKIFKKVVLVEKIYLILKKQAR